MANNNIGGFFVTLGMKVDDSFKKGEEAVSRFIGTATKTAAALVGVAKVAGSVENSNLKLAKSIGISGTELKVWQDTVAKAGVNAGALTSSMAALENKMQKMKYDGIDSGLAEKLGMLGIGYGDFAEMDATERMKSVFDAAGKMDDQGAAAALVGDTLGSAAREYYDWLALSGRKLEDELSASRALTFTTDDTMKSASAFNAEFNGLLNTTKSISLLIGSKIGEQLTPILRKLQEIMRLNKDFIASGIVGIFDVFKKIGSKLTDLFKDLKTEIPKFTDGFKSSFDFTVVDNIKASVSSLADAFKNLINSVGGSDDFSTSMGKIMGSIANFTGGAIVTAINMIKDLVNALKALLEGDWSQVGENLKSFFTDFKDGATSLFVGDQTDAMKGEGGIVSNTIHQILNPIDTVRNMQIQGGIADAFNAKYGQGASKYNALTGKLWLNPDMNLLKLNFNELTEELQKKIKEQAEEGYNITELYGGQIYNFPQINDGIVSPSGRVTKIASDDWVFAAKNLGDMASAFIPPSIANTTNNAPSTYAITQNFSFSGSTRDIAGMVQREAYNGTQSAITASMMQSNQRLQLMSGLR